MFMRDELGLWPHVRGAVGISTRGRDTGDAQIFVDSSTIRASITTTPSSPRC